MKLARRLGVLGLALALCAPASAFADTSPFDLAGPSLRIEVTHAGRTLPISEAPDISAGDQVSIRAELSPTQSAHYLLVTAFLRGPLNPPPASWFRQAKIWDARSRGGVRVTAPKGAEQMLVFLAPQTAGDYKTLVDTVRARPGAFVRAAQDLDEAALDRSRLDAYLSAVDRLSQSDPGDLKTVSPTLARSLGIKLKPDCLDQAPELQAPCLTQGQDSLVIDASHTSIIEALTSGYSAALMQQLSGSTPNGARYVSPYVSSLIDLAHIFESMRTAHYQYIPTLGVPHGDQLALKLNTPPSFADPKSVLVVALPTAALVPPPRLHAADPGETYCVEKTGLVLPVDGAPLVFSTAYLHDTTLRLTRANGRTVDLPAKADAERGGFLVDTRGLDASAFGEVVAGAIRGAWGFAPYSGPEFRLRNARAERWRLAAEDRGPLVAGRDTPIHLQAAGAACVDDVRIREPSGAVVATTWKVERPGVLAVTLPVGTSRPGAAAILVDQWGAGRPAEVPLTIFAPPSRLDGFVFRAGDASGVLRGRRLDEVAGLTFAGVAFQPGPLTATAAGDELTLVAADAEAAAGLKPGTAATAEVTLQDGRRLALQASVGAPRPSVTLIAQSIRPLPSRGGAVIRLAGDGELPRGARLTFSIRAEPPTSFSGDDEVQVATAQGTVLATLTLANGLTLEDSHVAVASLDTGKVFDTSAFGPLAFRVVVGGVPGAWRPLDTLVRLPTLNGLDCPAGPGQPCTLRGENLYLIDSVSADPAFAHAAEVPDGFPADTLAVPRPVGGRLYLKLHDDPRAVDQVVLDPAPPGSGSGSGSGSESAPAPTRAGGAPVAATTAAAASAAKPPEPGGAGA